MENHMLLVPCNDTRTGSYADPLRIITHSGDFSVCDCLDSTEYRKGPLSSSVVYTQDQRTDALSRR